MVIIVIDIDRIWWPKMGTGAHIKCVYCDYTDLPCMLVRYDYDSHWCMYTFLVELTSIA